ncbi:MAG: ABC transporter permease [Agathobacter sp.]|uniref:ABC transporter permease n=1 Tax=Agathobacter sp. TaxID=2021311 RepID=UPI00258FF86C|nr:ABC transporter permease [Agathobacter sp.]MCR5676985.1 ABC transporter permease [Agathobacter sp.]
MLRTMIFSWKTLFRDKANTFWILLFPIILGSFFKIAFGNLEATENISTIPVAIVKSDSAYDEQLDNVITQLSTEKGGFLEATYCTEEEAKEQLKEKEIVGILHSGEMVRLSVSENMKEQSMQQSILKTFVDRYNMQVNALTELLPDHMEQYREMIDALSAEITYNANESLGRHPDQSPYTQYFFNLLAMQCLFTAVGGVLVACHNQANMSELAKRITVAPTHKLIRIVPELLAVTIYEFVLNAVGFTYMAFILKIQLLDRLPFTILTMFLGCFVGVSLGFFIGCFGHFDQTAKQGLVFAVTMPLCFLSGLMIGNMNILIENHLPIVNRLNPAALLTDSFYRLSQYEDLSRFYTNILTIIGFIILFCVTGFLMTRRKTYAQL